MKYSFDMNDIQVLLTNVLSDKIRSITPDLSDSLYSMTIDDVWPEQLSWLAGIALKERLMTMKYENDHEVRE